jgi:integrase
VRKADFRTAATGPGTCTCAGSLRHQFASEALDASPRELANISQVLGHDSVQTTLRFYIHPSANAEQRIGAMMNARWTAPPSAGT